MEMRFDCNSRISITNILRIVANEKRLLDALFPTTSKSLQAIVS